MRLTSICAALWAILHASAASGVDSAPVPIADIAIELRHELPTTSVTLAGTQFQLFVDLGGFAPIGLTPTEIDIAHLNPAPEPWQFKDSFGHSFAAKRYVIPYYVVGGASFATDGGVEALYDQSNTPPDHNGYLGFGFFRGHVVILDYPAGHIRVYSPEEAQMVDAECAGNPFSLSTEGGMIRSHVTTERGELRILLDTGAMGNLIQPEVLSRDQHPAATNADAAPDVTLRSVALGGEELGPLDFKARAFSQPPVDAILGTPFFQSRKVCLDLARGRGRLSPGSRERPRGSDFVRGTTTP